MAGELDDIAKAWQVASDAEVMTGLARPDDYPSEVYAIVQKEAASRSLEQDPGNDDVHLCRPGVWLVPKKLGALIHAHAWLVATLTGAGLPLWRFAVPESRMGAWPGVYPALLNVVCILWLGFVCWPLRRYRVVLAVVLIWASCYTCTAIIGTRLMLGEAYQYPVLAYAVVLLAGTLLNAAIPCGVLCFMVLLRNRYWPIYPPGHCARCGYNLFGLTSGQCPECGEAFKSEGIGDSDVQSGE